MNEAHESSFVRLHDKSFLGQVLWRGGFSKGLSFLVPTPPKLFLSGLEVLFLLSTCRPYYNSL
jgi:hypothetical protein